MVSSDAHTFIEYPRGAAPRLGVVFPQTEFSGSTADMRAFAIDIERLGFNHVLAYDHVLGASTTNRPEWSGPYTSDDPFQEPFLLFSYMTAIAPRLEFTTGVLVLPQRETALVAKQAANLDFLTGGKFRLGVGIGWNPVEYEALNQEFTNRGARLSEQIDIIRQLTGNEVIDYAGTWHRIHEAGVRPLGVQRPIPIWIGANADVAVRRAARIADGFFVNGTSLERCDASMQTLRNELAHHERDEATFGLEVRVSVVDDNPDDWKRDFAHWREADVSHVSLVTLGAHLPELDQHMERFASAKRVWDEM